MLAAEAEEQINAELEIAPDSTLDDEIGLVRRAIQTHMRPIYDDDKKLVGRAAIIPSVFQFDDAGLGVLCVGGLRAEALSAHIAGIMLAEPQRASRDAATPLAGPEELGRWATEQADLIGKTSAHPKSKFSCASVVRSLGGDVLNLPVCLGASGWMTRDDLKRTDFPDEIVIVLEALLHNEFDEHGPVALHSHAFASEHFTGEMVAELRGLRSHRTYDPIFGHAIGLIDRASLAAIAEAAAASWGCSPDDLSDKVAQPSPDDAVEVGVADGRPFKAVEAIVLRKPRQ